MPITTFNGVRLFWESRGESGPPIVLVHGSWGDHHNWHPVVPGLARSFRVFTYDRRGHSQSERPTAQGSIEEDVADLAAFITANQLAPAHVAGNSFGAAITLKCVVNCPNLFASVIVHEPPFIGMIQDHPMMPHVGQRMQAVIDTLESGDLEGGARQFVEHVAFGPGEWERLPPDVRRTFIFNAPTWLDEMREPHRMMAVDPARLAAFNRPLLVTEGTASPPFFGVIVDRIAAGAPRVQRYTFDGAGHVPHLTHSDEYVRVTTDFVKHGRVAAREL